MAVRLLRSLVGLCYGLLAGFVVTLGVVVARARLEGVYLHGLGEIVGWVSSPVVVLGLLGAWLAASPRYRLAPAARGGAIGLALGVAVGAGTGALASSDPAWTWAGGILGGAVGLVAGFLGRAIRDVRGPWSMGAAGTVALAVALSSGCDRAPERPLPARGAVPEPSPEGVQAVVFLVGDPGVARKETHPVLAAVRRDVEAWSERLGPEGDVVLILLGDIVYPAGVRAKDTDGWAADSAVVADQVWMISGPEARRAGARAHFLAGNHDWGQEQDWDGAVRLGRLKALLWSFMGEGANVSLEPEPGTGGPAVLDVGDDLRLILLDTAWWLYDSGPWTRDRTLLGVQRALSEREGRRTVVAAHHPLRSGGPHGDLRRFGSTFGLRTLLARSGAILQDLYSEPYRELLTGLEAVFEAEGAPDVFAGGHEHSLQVIRGVRPAQPALSVVSGSASKLTEVEPVPGTLFAASAPGYVRLFVREGGRLEATVEAAPPRYLSCAGVAETAECMREAGDSFRTVWSGEVAPRESGAR